MKCLMVAASAAALMLAATAAQAASSDDAQIRALEQQFAAGFNAKDADAVMKCYVPDQSLFVFDVGTPRQHVGAADYRKDFQDFFGEFKGPLKFDLTDLSVTIDGNIGYGHSIQHFVGKDAKDKPVESTVRVTDVYRKIGGKWLIVLEHVSVPVDFATGKPDMMSRP